MGLWAPSRVDLARREEYRREVLSQAQMDATLDFWTAELKKLDPYLQMVRAKDNSELLRAGYYYVLRHNPGAPPSVICVEGPNGEFIEPNSGLFDLLRKQDMWSGEALRDKEKMERKAEQAELRRKEREQEDRVEEMNDRLRALTQTSISMSRSAKPWTQTAGARRQK